MRRTSGSTTWWPRVWRRQAWLQTQNSQVDSPTLTTHLVSVSVLVDIWILVISNALSFIFWKRARGEYRFHPRFWTKHWKAVALPVAGEVHARISWGESPSRADREQFGRQQPDAATCHAFRRQTGSLQRKGSRVQSLLFGRAVNKKLEAPSFVMLFSLTFNPGERS